jgi:hypothetical protein
MDDFGDLLGGLGEILGDMLGETAADGPPSFADFLSPERRRRDAGAVIVHERYLCGGPRKRNVNDR